MTFLRRFATRLIRSTVVFAALGVGLEVLMRAMDLSLAAFAYPFEVVQALPEFLDQDRSLNHVKSTFLRTIAAFGIALPLGLLSGFLVANAGRLRGEGEIFVDFVRSIPATALVPLFLVVLGTGDSSKVGVGAFSGSLALAISVIVGVRSLNPDRRLVADLLGLRGGRRVVLYELPEILPSIFVGARTAASLCLILVVVSEMSIGSASGLGSVIMDRRYSDDVPGLYGAIVMSGVIGYSINKVFVLLENHTGKILAVLGHLRGRLRQRQAAIRAVIRLFSRDSER